MSEMNAECAHMTPPRSFLQSCKRLSYSDLRAAAKRPTPGNRS